MLYDFWAWVLKDNVVSILNLGIIVMDPSAGTEEFWLCSDDFTVRKSQPQLDTPYVGVGVES